jgi:uncharacterized alkaline shock family protein YloU
VLPIVAQAVQERVTETLENVCELRTAVDVSVEELE